MKNLTWMTVFGILMALSSSAMEVPNPSPTPPEGAALEALFTPAAPLQLTTEQSCDVICTSGAIFALTAPSALSCRNKARQVCPSENCQWWWSADAWTDLCWGGL